MRKINIFLMALFVLLSPVLLVTLTTYITVGDVDPNPEIEIFMTTNSIHADLVLPVKNELFDWTTFLPKSEFGAGAQKAEWIELGWGDRRFYLEMPTWEHFTWGLAADALLTPDPALMHVSYLPFHPTDYDSVFRLKISKNNYLKLVLAMKQSFALKNGRPDLLVGKSYDDTDNFYEGTGQYSLARTCNAWTADMLRDLGLKAPLFSPTKAGLSWAWREERLK